MYETAQCRVCDPCYAPVMSERNGDRARFNRNQKRKRHHRQRIHALIGARRKQTDEDLASRSASNQMQDEGAPLRTGD